MDVDLTHHIQTPLLPRVTRFSRPNVFSFASIRLFVACLKLTELPHSFLTAETEEAAYHSSHDNAPQYMRLPPQAGELATDAERRNII